MATRDGITPDTDRVIAARRGSATNLLLLLHAGAFLLAAAAVQVAWLRPAAEALPFSAGPALAGLEAWRYFTWTFAHGLQIPSLCAMVLFGWVLYRMGNELEAECGPWKLLALYAGSSLYGAVGHHAWQVLRPAPAEVATGLAAPALAVFLAWAWRHRSRTLLFLLVLPLRARPACLIALTGTLILAAGWSAHGAAPGAIAAAALGAWIFVSAEPLLDRRLDAWESRARRRRYLEEFDLRRRCEEILGKISREGMASITRAERATLKRASRLYGRPDEGP